MFTLWQLALWTISSQLIASKNAVVKWGEECLPEFWASLSRGLFSSSPKLLPAQGNSSRSICPVLDEWCSWSSMSSGEEIPVSRVPVMLRSPNSSTTASWMRRVAAWKLPTGRGDEWVVPLGCAFFSRRSKWNRQMMIADRLQAWSARWPELFCCGTLTCPVPE
jgi:hypothetical protein